MIMAKLAKPWQIDEFNPLTKACIMVVVVTLFWVGHFLGYTMHVAPRHWTPSEAIMVYLAPVANHLSSRLTNRDLDLGYEVTVAVARTLTSLSFWHYQPAALGYTSQHLQQCESTFESRMKFDILPQDGGVSWFVNHPETRPSRHWTHTAKLNFNCLTETD